MLSHIESFEWLLGGGGNREREREQQSQSRQVKSSGVSGLYNIMRLHGWRETPWGPQRGEGQNARASACSFLVYGAGGGAASKYANTRTDVLG